MFGRERFFPKSYRLYVSERKSVGWQSAFLRQLVGTRKIQDGCHDPGKLQKVFIFTLLHAGDIMLVSTRKLWRMKTVMEPFIIYVHVTIIQNGRHFYQQ